LVASYDFWPVNGAGLLSQEKISKATSEEKRISGEAYDVNKQMIYMAPKSTNESRTQYSPEPAWGIYSGVIMAQPLWKFSGSFDEYRLNTRSTFLHDFSLTWSVP